MATVEAAASFGASRLHHHATLPASPTLTNPDMILPEYDRSPSPVALAHSVWALSQAASEPHPYDPTAANATISTPIIYGNGTMLSDIGEVTEAESTPARPSPPRSRYVPTSTALPAPRHKVDDSEGGAALRSSPTIAKSAALGSLNKRAKAAHRDRRSSSDSTSNITDHFDQSHKAALPDDFDDTVSIGDSVFQGDDEESLASSYLDDDASLASIPALSSAFDSRDKAQKYSTAMLSRRAEQILANAKKRLTHMEDNLSRARSSLLVATKTPGSTTASPSPPITRASAALMMSGTGQKSPGSNGHHRTGSDSTLRIGIPVKVYPRRSSSVLGISTGPRHPGLTISRSADQLNGQFNRQRASYMVVRDLEPLGENDVSQPQRQSALATSTRYTHLTNPTFGASTNKGLSRSASTSHMRDIRDQVNDLKGKISSLREQTRADSLKRSSLQNLRTPSPFTHAKINQWYTNTANDSGPSPQVQGLDALSWNGDSRREGDFGAEDVASPGGISLANRAVVLGTSEHGQLDRSERPSSDPFEYEIEVATDGNNDDLFTEDGNTEADALYEYEEAGGDGDDAVSEGGDSIYHESVPHHLSHEDREDAFDYEHFFLHSAMGTISQNLARRASHSSFTSEDSVETTRAPAVETENMNPGKPSHMARRGSDASISTMESFATAEERFFSRQESLDVSWQEEAEEDDEVQVAEAIKAEAFPESHPRRTALDSPVTPPTAKRATFTGVGSPFQNMPLRAEQGNTRLDGLNSAVRRPMSSAAFTRPHAPSVSSFESTGTTRSFPLVNRSASKSSGSSGVLTPESRSSEADGRAMSSILSCDRMSQSGAGAMGGANTHNIGMHSRSAASLIEENDTTAVMETLPRDDRFLVERLVASLGRCVLGLTENSWASTEARMYRRRIDAARKILEGFDKL